MNSEERLSGMFYINLVEQFKTRFQDIENFSSNNCLGLIEQISIHYKYDLRIRLRGRMIQVKIDHVFVDIAKVESYLFDCIEEIGTKHHSEWCKF